MKPEDREAYAACRVKCAGVRNFFTPFRFEILPISPPLQLKIFGFCELGERVQEWFRFILYIATVGYVSQNETRTECRQC